MNCRVCPPPPPTPPAFPTVIRWCTPPYCLPTPSSRRDNHSLPPLFTRNPHSRNQLAKPFRSLPDALVAPTLLSNTFLILSAPFPRGRALRLGRNESINQNRFGGFETPLPPATTHFSRSCFPRGDLSLEYLLESLPIPTHQFGSRYYRLVKSFPPIGRAIISRLSFFLNIVGNAASIKNFILGHSASLNIV